MVIDQIKEHIVRINAGSGVLLQPSCDKTTYILTCDHVVKKVEVGYDVPLARIWTYDQTSRNYTTTNEILLYENSNYFRDEKLDIAVIIIPKVNLTTDLVCIEEYDRFDGHIRLCGFPDSRREGNVFLLRDDPNISLSLENTLGKREARIPGNLRHQDIVGQSGGPIYCLDRNRVGLLGIQNLVPVKDEELGRILFTPITDFKKVVAASEGKLESMEPYYMKDFSHVLPETFNLAEERITSEARKKMVFALKEVAKTIISKNITPKEILDSIERKFLLLKNQEPEDLNLKNLWCFWLEMLVVIQVYTRKDYSEESLANIFKRFRFFYSNINQDFFLKHLEDICYTDYDGLENNGLVVVASNASTSIKPFLDREDIIPDISEIEDKIALENHLLKIDNPRPFAVGTYKFMNISAFKDYTLANNYTVLNEVNHRSILDELFKIYGSYINR